MAAYNDLMKTTTLVWIVIIIIVIGGVLWVSTQNSPASNTGATTSNVFGSSTTSTSSQSNTSQQSSSSMIVPGSNDAPIVGDNLMLGTDQNSKLGTYLIGYTGMTLYTYAKDNVGTSTCYASCAQTWAPYVVSPSDRYNLQYGVNASKVGTITRADGTLQLTYSGHPLYFFSGDKTGSDFNGQGVGGVWYVIAP